jgi:hypothetical protein
MVSSRTMACGILALVVATGSSLHSQSAPAIQLAFGYECGDRFIVINDGDQPVLVEYAAAGTQDRSQLHLNAKQSAEIASAQDGNLELWVGGRVVASQPKGNRPCAVRATPPVADTTVAPPPASPPVSAPPIDSTRPPSPTQPPDSTGLGDAAAPPHPPAVAFEPPDYLLYLPSEFNHFSPPRSPLSGIIGNVAAPGGSIRRSTVREASGGGAHK